MRRLARILACGLFATTAACISEPPPPGGPPPGPTYSRETILGVEVFGIHLGMEGGAACRVLKDAGFSRGRWIDTDVDCSTFPDDDSDDTFFGRGPQAATPFGRLRAISFEYRKEGVERRVSNISIYTDEKGQEAKLEAATREQFGTPTFYAKWAYRVLNYGQTAEQADFDNRSDFDSCVHSACLDAEEAGHCIPMVERFSTATIQVVVFDWGRTIEVSDDTDTDHSELVNELGRIRDSTLVHLCPLNTIH